ncbi:MAG: DUF4340 domain-containing protein [Pseudomonadota bacterium]
MSARAFAILCVLAAALAAIAFLAMPSKPSEKEGAGGLLLAGLSLNDVAAVTLLDAEKSVSLSRSDGAWRVDGFADLPAEQGKVRALLLSLSQLTIDEIKTDDPKLHDAVGLGGSGTTIQLGESLGVILGKDAAGGGRFARRLNEDQSYVVSQINPPQTGVKAWLDIDVPTIPAATVTKVDIQSGEERYSVIKGEGGALTMTGLKEDEALAYDTVLETVIGGAVYIDFEDIAAAGSIDWTGADSSVFYGAQDSDLIRYDVAQADEMYWLRVTPQGTLVPEGDIDWSSYAFAVSEYRKGALVKQRSELLEAPDPS